MEKVIVPPSIQPFWDQFQASVQGSVDDDISARFYESFHFDDNEKDANELLRLVLNGRKCATASLLWTFEAEQKPLPYTGALSVVTDWSGQPSCVIESTIVDILPYREVTEAFASTEGEGDGSLAFWRRVHWLYFGRECERLGRQLSEGMPVVCEQFKVVYKAG